jgi:hypothetical protein
LAHAQTENGVDPVKFVFVEFAATDVVVDPLNVSVFGSSPAMFVYVAFVFVRLLE